MNIRIPVPRFVIRALNRFEDWGNVVIWESATGRWYLYRLDLLIASGFMFCTSYYWFMSGWIGALQGAAMYIFVSMCALWLFRREP